jgi:hypothetical protein
MKIIAQLLGTDLVVEVVPQWRLKRKHWARQGPRRHQRRNKSFLTLCGRWAKDVICADPEAKYPKNRSNCKACYEVEMAALCRGFKASTKRWEKREIDLKQAEQEFLAGRYDGPKRRRT